MLESSFQSLFYIFRYIDRLIKGKIATGAAGTLAVKVSGTGLNFAANIVLARLLGASSYGAYGFALAWTEILTIPAVLGLDQLLAREVAYLRQKQEWASIKYLLRQSDRLVILSSIVVTLLAVVLVSFLEGTIDPEMSQALYISLALIPITAMMLEREGFLRGLGRVVSGQLPNQLVKQAAFLTIIGIMVYCFAPAMSGADAVAYNVVGGILALSLSISLLRYYRPKHVKTAVQIRLPRKVFVAALPFTVIAGLSVINAQADVVMLGFMIGAEETGIYRIITRLVMLIGIALLAVNIPLGPAISELYAKNDIKKIQELTTKAAVVATTIAFPVAVAFFFTGEWILLFLFGHEFEKGATALALLAVGQLFNALAGSVGVLLAMTKYEKLVIVGLSISGIINIGLNFLLIPSFGIEGAAVAAMTSMFIWNLLLVYFVWKKLDIQPSLLEIYKKWRLPLT